MKNKFPSYRIFSSIGLILILSTMYSNIFWVRYIFGSLGVLLELVSLILLVKELCSKNKSSQESVQNEEVNININSKRLRYVLLSLFSSILSFVSIFVLFLFFSVEKIEMWRIYLIAIAIVQAVVIIFSSVEVFCCLNKRIGDN